jgi:hypothetical protein
VSILISFAKPYREVKRVRKPQRRGRNAVAGRVSQRDSVSPQELERVVSVIFSGDVHGIDTFPAFHSFDRNISAKSALLYLC